jgi:two-component system sensor histidine kinase KdpD
MTGSPARLRTAAEWGAWLASLAALTAALAAVRPEPDRAHVALAYLLLVLASSARGTRLRGLVLALLAFLAFNFFFLPPFEALVVHDPRDWIVLLTFLAVAGVATQLLHRARREAEVARRRADEVERLSTLGAETLNATRAEDALAAIAEVIRGTLALDGCEIYLPAEGGGILLAAAAGTAAPRTVPASAALAAEGGTGVVERIDGTMRRVPTASAEIPEVAETAAASLPLRVRDRLVGILRIRREEGVMVDAAQRRFFAALAYYAALGAERARLAAEAQHAEALREADRLKDALLAAVSHDLRTPLTAIKALAHDLATEGDERAEEIETQADRLNGLVADLLDLSRLNAGALQLRPEIAAAEDLAGAALQSLAGTLDGRPVHIHLPDGPLLLGRFDFVHALRVLVNLLENAHKYSPPGAPIDLSAGREGDALVFRVEDRGPGIPPEERERVFEPFYRRPGRAPDVGGAGLGLAISRRLAEAQGGSLHHAPRVEGGSTFVFTLPAADAEPGSL